MNSHSLILINQPCKAINALILIKNASKKCVIIITYDTKRNRDSDLIQSRSRQVCVQAQPDNQGKQICCQQHMPKQAIIMKVCF